MPELTAERALALLHNADLVGVCTFAQDGGEQPDIEMWPRSRAEQVITLHGAMLTGPKAGEANFGICCMTAPGQYVFFETAHT